MIIFVAICVFGFIVLVGGSLFGHDHDVDHDHSFEHDHDASDSNEPTVSIFSLKVIGTFIMGFGAAGAIAQYATGKPIISSLWGFGSGVVTGLVMYLFMRALYGQQSSSLVETDRAIGQAGTVSVTIGKGAAGQIDVEVAGLHMTYLATSADGEEIPRGRAVRVVANEGGKLVVQNLVR